MKGEENGAESDAPVRLFVMGADYWRDEADWPPPDAVVTELLPAQRRSRQQRGRRRRTRRAPSCRRAGGSYEYDPRSPAPTVGGTTFLPGLHIAENSGPRDQAPLEARDDVLCYTTAPLGLPLEIVGPVQLLLHVSSTAPDTDFTATLADVGPDGRAFNVVDGVARARYRTSRTSPSLLEPGKIYELPIELGGTAHVFRRGHRVRVLVTSGSFPRYERNPQTGALPAESARPAAGFQPRAS